MEATHFANCQTIWPWKVETQSLVIHHLANRLLREVEPRTRRMWSHPALHLIKILFDVMCSKRLTVLETYSSAHLHFESTLIEPVCISCQGIDHTPILIHADRLFHSVPRDK